MSLAGDVVISVADGGGSQVVVPGSSVQVKIGCSTSGTVNQIFATRSLKTLQDNLGGGPLVEAAGLAIATSKAVCICIKVPTVTPGYVQGSTNATKAITGATNATPTVLHVVAHGLITGSVVTVAGVGGNTGANGTFVATVTDADHISIPVDTSAGGAYTSGGTVQFDGLVVALTGTSVPTASGAATDRLFVELKVTKGGTLGVAGITFTVSLDAGRNVGPSIALGTANSYLIPGTGITVAFAAGTLVAGDRIRFCTVAPLWDTAGVVAALEALKGSGYAAVGWGAGTHIVGYATGANAATFQTKAEDLANNFVWTRLILEQRDAHEPTAWGGLGETEAAWMAAIETDISSANAKRCAMAAGEYNMPSAFANDVAGIPSYRRPLAWAFAARQAQISPQRHAGRRRPDDEGGALSQITVDATVDPNDGFIYHDERVNPGLDPYIPGGASRYTSARTVIGKGGIFISNPISLAQTGSDYVLVPRGRVMDLVAFIAHQIADDDVNDDVRVNDGSRNTVKGTIDERDARIIEQTIAQGLTDQMVAPGFIVGAKAVLSRTDNVSNTLKISGTIRVVGKGYLLEIDLNIGFASASAAA